MKHVVMAFFEDTIICNYVLLITSLPVASLLENATTITQKLVPMSCCIRIPHFLPSEYKAVLNSLYRRQVPSQALEFIASYLWDPEMVCVASRDGYLRIFMHDAPYTIVAAKPHGHAVWCLCQAWNNIYLSLHEHGLRVYGLGWGLPFKHRFNCLFTFTCLCHTPRFLCAGSDFVNTFFVFSPTLEVQHMIVLSPPRIFSPGEVCYDQANCCAVDGDTVYLGCDNGAVYHLSSLMPEPDDPNSLMLLFRDEIFALEFDRYERLLFVGLADSLLVVRVDSRQVISSMLFRSPVWSISSLPGSILLVGVYQYGVVVLRRLASGLLEYREAHSGIGTSSATSYTRNGSWYAASNHSRIYYYCAERRTLASRYVADAIVERDDFVPRRDIYDVDVFAVSSLDCDLYELAV